MFLNVCFPVTYGSFGHNPASQRLISPMQLFSSRSGIAKQKRPHCAGVFYEATVAYSVLPVSFS